MRATDAPGPNPAAAEARLASLRLEVARLQMIHDELGPSESQANTDGATPNSTTRRNDDARATSSASGATKSTNRNGATETPAVDANLTAFEPVGFTVDPVLQGEALYRAERYSECVTVLRKAPDEPRAQYWSARALEKLNKPDEAIAIYTKLAARTDGGWATTRAKSDLEFLQWKREIEPRPEPAPSRGGTPNREPNTKGTSQP